MKAIKLLWVLTKLGFGLLVLYWLADLILISTIGQGAGEFT